jgi:hypothetical protein
MKRSPDHQSASRNWNASWLTVFAGAILLPACEGVILDGVVEPPPGSGGAPGNLGAAGAGGACVAGGLPAEVQAFVASCSACHGPTPLPGLPSLASYQGLTAASAVDPTQTNAERALARAQSATNPMPPAGSPTPAASDVAALQGWIAAGYPMAACSSVGAGGTSGTDPFALAPTCTSQRTWSGGNDGSAAMNPGQACIGCHRSTGGEAPAFGIAGTLYPTGHEPDLCNGSNGAATGAKIVLTDAQGKVITLTPNEVGNFTYRGNVAMPFQAAVTYMGRERRMASPPPSGDCNSCHTVSGTMDAPGRIVVP